MNILVFSSKGGVGKSSLSIALQMTNPEYQIITNDKLNPCDMILDDKQFYLIPDGADIPYKENSNIIYDFGGFPDSRIIKLLDKNIKIIIPFNPDIVSFKSAIKIYNEIMSINSSKKIIFVINKAKKNDLDIFKEQLEKLGINKPIYEIKESKFFSNIFNKRQTIEDIKQDKLLSYTYKPVIEQLKEIVKELNK